MSAVGASEIQFFPSQKFVSKQTVTDGYNYESALDIEPLSRAATYPATSTTAVNELVTCMSYQEELTLVSL